MYQRFTLLALGVLMLPALPMRTIAQSSYTVVDVGLLAGTAYNYPRAINNNANGVEVVGVSQVKSGAQYVMGHAFYWSQRAGIVDIGVLGADVSSTAQDINSSGEVVGSSYATHNSLSARPIYWNAGRGAGTGLALPMIPGGTGRGRAVAISDTGTIVGQCADSTGAWIGVVWKPDSPGVYSALTVLPSPVGGSTVACGINSSGSITGQYVDAGGWRQSCVWAPDLNGNYTLAPLPLGTPVSSAQSINQGLFINAGGQVVAQSDLGEFFCGSGGTAPILDLNGGSTGSSVYMTGLNDSGQAAGSVAKGSAVHAALWQGGVTYDLGTLGGTSSYAASSYDAKINPVYTGFTVNSSGQVVGYSQTTGNKAVHAFVWSSGLGMRDLNNLTANKGSFTSLQDGTGINDAGVITGTGILKNGLTHAYVAFPKP